MVLIEADRELSLAQAAVLYGERFGIAGAAPARNANVRRLLRDWLERELAAGADWIHPSGSPGTAGRRYRVSAVVLQGALDALPRCEAPDCERPALRDDGRCGSCGHGRTGRPREVEWKIRTCASCGKVQEAPLYGRQKRWHCDDCNGRQKHEPVELRCKQCAEPFVGTGRRASEREFCGYKCSADYKWAHGILTVTDEHRSRWQRMNAERREATEAIKTSPGVLTLPDVAKLVHVSSWTPYGWRERGLLSATEHFGGRLLTTSDEEVRELIRKLARVNSPRLLDPMRCVASAKVVRARRDLILPHRAGAKPKHELRAELLVIACEVKDKWGTVAAWTENDFLFAIGEAAWDRGIAGFRDRYPGDRHGIDPQYRQPVYSRVRYLVGSEAKALQTATK